MLMFGIEIIAACILVFRQLEHLFCLFLLICSCSLNFLLLFSWAFYLPILHLSLILHFLPHFLRNLSLPHVVLPNSITNCKVKLHQQ